MSEDVGSRLVRVGLASREQLAEALSLSQRTGMSLVEAIVCSGVDEEAIERLFVQDGLAAPLGADALSRSSPLRLLGFDGAMALAFLAFPIRADEGRLEVAMTDPSDAHATAELRRRAGADVVPRVGRVSVIRAAILASYPDASAALVDLEAPPREPRSLLDSVPVPAAVPTARTVAEVVRPDEPATPLRRSSIPPSRTKAPSPAADRWGDLGGSDPSAARSVARAPLGPRAASVVRLPEVASALAGIRAAEGRDEAIGLACEACVALARSAVFFVVRGETVRGHVGRGPYLDDARARLVEVPLTSDSFLARAAREARPYFGPFAATPIDQMLRASIGSRGGRLAVKPVAIGGRVVGLLVVDEVQHGERGDERIEMIAHALGLALQRRVSDSRKA